MTRHQRSSSRHLFLLGPLLAGLCCPACDDKTYDLDQATSKTTGYSSIFGFVMDQDRLYGLEQYQERAETGPSGNILFGCEKHDCSATRQSYIEAQPGGSMLRLPCFAARNRTVFFTKHSDYTVSGALTYITQRESIWELKPHDETEPERLFEFPGGVCNGMAVDDTELYRLDDSGVILALSLTSDPFPRVLATGQPEHLSTSQFLAYGDYLYWASSPSGIRRTRKDGTGPVEVLAVDASASALAVDESYLYWTDTQLDALLRCSPADCAETTTRLASINSIPVGATDTAVEPHSLQVQGDSLFWLEGTEGSPSLLRRCSINGCASGPELFVAPKVYFFAVDATDVYAVALTDASATDAGLQQEIRRFPR